MLLLDTARALSATGSCVIPTRADGSKAPAVRWEQYQHAHPSAEQLEAWFSNGAYDGLGVVCGRVSGGLELLELEGRATHLGQPLQQALADAGHADLWARLCAGYLEQSPSGGYHWLYRVDGTPRGNTKLARRPATPDELEQNPADKVKVLIETRGEGGFCVVAPSAGRTHPTGRPWLIVNGGPDSIPTITEQERDLLYQVCTGFDQMPVIDQIHETSNKNPVTPPSGERPGDDFNQRATWGDILTPHGWTRGRRLGSGWAWTRPGKNPRDGMSATTGTAADGVDRLYVFSSSTVFDAETPYSKFAAYAVLEHSGDMSAAASQLRAGGYGAPLEEARPDLTFTGPPAPPNAPAGPPVVPGPTSYSLTDDGNALRLVDKHSDEIRFCPQRGLWLRWTGHRWAWDDAETVRELARGIARTLPADNDTQRRHRQKSLSNNAIAAQVRLARSDPRVITHIGDLDAHPRQLNTPAGITDLETGRLMPSDPAQLHTRSTNVAPDPTHPHPQWDRFLADTFAGDPELTVYVQRLLGVSLYGEVLEQILPIALGTGSNGKTTLLGVILRVIGIGETGYAISAPAEILLATRNQDHPASIAQLSGARIVVTSELEEGQNFAEAQVKKLTGSDPINARFMRQNPFTFLPTHTLWLLANYRPQVRAGGEAFWRRIKELPFAHTVPLAQRDPNLEARLAEEEGPAILAWLIQGATDYLTKGLAVPESVQSATGLYQRDQDTVSRFVDEMCETGSPGDPTFRTKSHDIRSAYESWCHVEGETTVNPKAFVQGLKTRYGAQTERDHYARWLTGIRLRELTPPPDQPWGSQQLRWDQM